METILLQCCYLIKHKYNKESATKCTISRTLRLQLRNFFHVLYDWRRRLCLQTEPFNFPLNYLTHVIETHTRLIQTLSTNVQ